MRAIKRLSRETEKRQKEIRKNKRKEEGKEKHREKVVETDGMLYWRKKFREMAERSLNPIMGNKKPNEDLQRIENTKESVKVEEKREIKETEELRNREIEEELCREQKERMKGDKIKRAESKTREWQEKKREKVDKKIQREIVMTIVETVISTSVDRSIKLFDMGGIESEKRGNAVNKEILTVTVTDIQTKKVTEKSPILRKISPSIMKIRQVFEKVKSKPENGESRETESKVKGIRNTFENMMKTDRRGSIDRENVKIEKQKRSEKEKRKLRQEKKINEEKPKENIRGWIENNLTEPDRNRIVENRSKRKRENEETEKGSGRKFEKISKEVQKCAEENLIL